MSSTPRPQVPSSLLNQISEIVIYCFLGTLALLLVIIGISAFFQAGILYGIRTLFAVITPFLIILILNQMGILGFPILRQVSYISLLISAGLGFLLLWTIQYAISFSVLKSVPVAAFLLSWTFFGFLDLIRSDSEPSIRLNVLAFVIGCLCFIFMYGFDYFIIATPS